MKTWLLWAPLTIPPDLISRGFHDGNWNVRIWMRYTGQASSHNPGFLGWFIILLAVAFFLWLRLVIRLARERRAAGAEAGAPADPLAPLRIEYRFLLRRIAELDRRYQEGSLAKEEHAAVRRLLKGKLLKVAARLRAAESMGRGK